MQFNLINVNKVRKRTKSGFVYYYYHRLTGQRIQGEPGTIAFVHGYEVAGRHQEAKADGASFNSLLLAYQKSPDFKKLKPNTQRLYRGYIGRLSKRYGAVPLAAFNDRKIKTEILGWRDELAVETPGQAEGLIRFAKVALSFGVDRSLIEHNHLRLTKRIKTKDHSEAIWDAEQIKRILAVCPDYLQWAIKLALLTGQRISDLVSLKWSNITKDNYLVFRQAKTNALVELPITGALASLLASIPRKGGTILTSSLGRAWCADGSSLRQAWRVALAKCGYAENGLRFHDLRGTAITCLADMGCTEIQIAAFTGHSLEHVSKILKHYLGRTRAQAVQAVAKLETSWIGGLG